MQKLINRVVIVAGVVWLVIAIIIGLANDYIAKNTVTSEEAEAHLGKAREIIQSGPQPK